MMFEQRRTGHAALSCLVLLAGCRSDLMVPTMGDVKEFARLGRSQLDAHDRNITGQHQEIAPDLAGALQAQRARFEQRLEEIGKKTDALESRQVELLRDSLEQAGRLAALPDGLRQEIELLLAPRVDAARRDAVSARQEAVLARASMDELTRSADHTDTRVADVEQGLAQLDRSIRDKIESAGEESRARLETLRRDAQALRTSLVEELSLTPAQLDELKGMTTEEIIGLLAAALGAAGVGLAGARGGKSRAEPRIARIEAKVSELAEETKLRTPVPTA